MAFVMYAGGNFGPRYFFDARVFDIFGGGPVIYSDPDLDFDFLADGFITKLLYLSHKYKQFKVGPALEIPNSKDQISNVFEVDGVKYSVADWEQRFWMNELEPCVYDAVIDTTFHLFNPSYFIDGLYHHLGGIRVSGDGFTFKHLPWYKVNRIPPEEFEFYKTSSGHSSWI